MACTCRNRVGLIPLSRQDTSLCTVDLLHPKAAAAARTVAPCCTMYSPSKTARWTGSPFIPFPPPLLFIRYAERENGMRTAQGEVGAAIPVRQAISRNVLCASVSIDAKGPRRLSGGAAWIKRPAGGSITERPGSWRCYSQRSHSGCGSGSSRCGGRCRRTCCRTRCRWRTGRGWAGRWCPALRWTA